MVSVARLPLRIRLPLYAVLGAFLVGLTTAVCLQLFGGALLSAQAQDEIAHNLHLYSDAVHNYLDTARSLLETTAGEPDLLAAAGTAPAGRGRDRGQAAGRIQELAERLVARGRVFEHVLLLDADGTVRLAAPAQDRGRLFPSNLLFAEWYRDALGSGKTVTSDLIVSPVTQEPTVAVAVPLADGEGRPAGMWVGLLWLKGFSALCSIQPGSPAPLQHGYVTDRRGLVLAHQSRPRYVERQTDFFQVPGVRAALLGESGVAQYLNPVEREEQLSAFMPLPKTGWAVVFAMPAHGAVEGLRRLTWLVVGVSLLVAAIVGVGGWRLADRMIRPLFGLVEAAEHLREGDLRFRVPNGRSDEFGLLGQAFNRMADTLAENQETLRGQAERLEREVADRTVKLRESERRLSTLVDNLPGVAYRSAADPQWTMEFLSGGIEALSGYPAEEFVGNRRRSYGSLIHPEDRQAVEARVRDALADRASYELEYRISDAAGAKRWVWERGCGIFAADGSVAALEGFISDITERKRAEELAARHAADLARSNRDLEQFAYVASHDLQEPLRMVASYVQLLSRRYEALVDADGREFIGYAVDGAKRMQRLINDLLAYSRVSTRGGSMQPVALQAILEETLATFRLVLAESGAEVTSDPLPTIQADPAQLLQLFQNLLGNALKFRGERPPRIHVGAVSTPAEWILSVRDNGIGIDPRYADRIFVIFQRLHERNAYPGTGIGLALCKKIVERHRGRIWVESAEGAGATFFVVLPRSDRAEILPPASAV